MADDDFTPARKRQFVIAFCLMAFVLVLAVIMARFGGDIYYKGGK